MPPVPLKRRPAGGSFHGFHWVSDQLSFFPLRLPVTSLDFRTSSIFDSSHVPVGGSNVSSPF